VWENGEWMENGGPGLLGPWAASVRRLEVSSCKPNNGMGPGYITMGKGWKMPLSLLGKSEARELYIGLLLGLT